MEPSRNLQVKPRWRDFYVLPMSGSILRDPEKVDADPSNYPTSIAQLPWNSWKEAPAALRGSAQGVRLSVWASTGECWCVLPFKAHMLGMILFRAYVFGRQRTGFERFFAGSKGNQRKPPRQTLQGKGKSLNIIKATWWPTPLATDPTK